MKIIHLTPSSPELRRYRPAILQLIASSNLSLSEREVEAYLTAPNEVRLALAGDEVKGVCVGTLRRSPGLICFGLLLVVVHQSARGQGLLGRLAVGYFLRQLPRLAWAKLRSPRTPAVGFADVCNPVSYRRLHFGERIYPDLVRGNPAAENTRAQALRAELRQVLNLDDLDVATGLLRHGSGKGLQRSSDVVGDKWSDLWRAAIPDDHDLLVLIPIEPAVFAKLLPLILRLVIGRLPSLRRRGASPRAVAPT